MKMTQEEKAKAYDEAIKKLHEIITMDNHPVLPKEIGEYLFPELRESEDERIRKALIWHLKADVDFVSNGVTKAECIAYLEKMKEASKAIEAVDRIDKYIDENVANAHDMKDSNPDKKYYRGWDDALGEMAGILQDVYSDKKQKEMGIQWFKSDEVKNPDKPYIDKAGMFYTTDGRMCLASEIEKQKEEQGYVDTGAVIEEYKNWGDGFAKLELTINEDDGFFEDWQEQDEIIVQIRKKQ